MTLAQIAAVTHGTLAASLRVLADAGAHRSGRTVAVLGAMRELGIDQLIAIEDAVPAAEGFGGRAATVGDRVAAMFALIDQLTREFDVEPTGAAYAVVEPVLFTVALICICLGLKRLLRWVHADFVFDPPFAQPSRNTATPSNA